MNRSRGFTLVELICILPIIVMAFFLLSQIVPPTVRAIPRTRRIINARISMDSFLESLKDDMNNAQQFMVPKDDPPDYALCIERADKVILYIYDKHERTISRFRLTDEEAQRLDSWKIGSGKVTFRVTDAPAPAAIVCTCAVETIDGEEMEKLTDTRMMFIPKSETSE